MARPNRLMPCACIAAGLIILRPKTKGKLDAYDDMKGTLVVTHATFDICTTKLPATPAPLSVRCKQFCFKCITQVAILKSKDEQ